MAMTKKDRARIDRAIGHLTRAINFINDPRTAVAFKGGMATTTLHYTRADGAVLYEVSKEIGSDLTGLEMGRKELLDLLFTDAAKRV